MIKQKTIMIATKQNMVKQAIGVGNMKIMKKMITLIGFIIQQKRLL